MREWLVAQPVLIGHNIQRYDIPNLERLLNIKIKARLIDTLALSWYLYPQRSLHGLESWGEDFNVKKPEVEDWDNLSYEEYAHRCEQDVEINTLLWNKIKKHLSALYEVSEDEVEFLPIIRYLEFKIDCAKEQEKSKWRIDKELASNSLAELTEFISAKTEALKQVMPKVKEMGEKRKPAKMFKKNGQISSAGEAWLTFLNEMGLPEDHEGPVVYVKNLKEPNPVSTPQVKDWLFELGWEPISFKYDKNEDGSLRPIPQVRVDGEEGKELCQSVKDLIEVEPGIKELEGLTVAQHRAAILEGFIENMDEEGFVQAQINGLTNTLRFKHKTVVNLPGVFKPWGSHVRGCLIARDGFELCGSDMSSLEDLTKRHYMYEYDPEYVNEMSAPGFDPHLNLALFANAVTEEDVSIFKDVGKKKKENKPISHNEKGVFDFVSVLRKNFKVTNYSATYGVGAPKLSREMKVPLNEAKKLLEAYWKRNWAIRSVADACRVKRILGQEWLYNPVSKFWYSLRAEKDKFSTLNQSTGVYCFDSWVREIRKVRPQLTAQFHDEIVIEVKKGFREEVKKLLQSSLDKVNERLKLNVTLAIDIQFGNNYAEIH